MKSVLKQINIEVSNFMRWAKNTNKKTGEWETRYPDWGKIYSLIEESLDIIEYNKLTELDKDNLLYLLSRDNELEEIARQLSEFPDLIIPLANYGLNYHDYNARWQLANYIWKHADNYQEVEEILISYYKDNNEYVKRRALLALGYMESEYAEQLALESWNTGLKHQKMVSLYILDEINSKRLNELLNKGEDDEFKIVRNTAKNIEKQRGF
ncbi:MAG: hypothetical protein ACOC1K_06350 [Nanoarchaeota archaeon]